MFLVCLGFKGISQLHLDALSKAVGEDTEADEGPRMTMVSEEAVDSRPVDELTDSKKLSSFIVGSGFP